jgi:predicted Zn-ribbon and HTH transcriptional regulator
VDDEFMSDYTDLIFDGTLCEGCGVFMNDEPVGHPVKCRQCKILDIETKKSQKQVDQKKG